MPEIFGVKVELNDGGYRSSEMNAMRDKLSQKELDEMRQELEDLKQTSKKQQKEFLDQWISKEVIPAQKFHYQTFHSDKQLGGEVQKLSAFLSNKDNNQCLTDLKVGDKNIDFSFNVDSFDGYMQMIRAALIRANWIMTQNGKQGFLEKEGQYTEDGKALFQKITQPKAQFDEYDLMAIIAFQKKSEKYKQQTLSDIDESYRDKVGMTTKGKGGEIDGVIGPRTLRALMEECSIDTSLTSNTGEALKTKTISYIDEKGRVFFVKADGTYQEVSDRTKFEMSDANTSQQQSQLLMLLDFADAWKNTSQKVISNIDGKWFKGDDVQLLKEKNSLLDAKIKEIVDDYNALMAKGELYTADKINKAMKDIFDIIDDAEEKETVIGNDDVKTVKDVISGYTLDKDFDNETAKIYGAVARRTSDALGEYVFMGGGNSELAKQKFIDLVLKKPEFSKEKNLIDTAFDQKLYDMIVNQNSTGLQAEGVPKNIAKDIIGAYKKIADKQNKVRTDYYKHLKQQYPGASVAEINKAVDEMVNHNIKEATRILFADGLMFETLQDFTGKEDESVKQLKKTLGVGRFQISDENIDAALAVAETVAMSAVSMGVGGLVARGALMAGRAGMAALQAGRLGSIGARGARWLNGSTRAARMAKFGLTTAVEGVAFHQGANLSINILQQKDISDRFENALDRKENLKSVGFVSVLKGIALGLSKLKIPNTNSLIATNRGLNTEFLRIGKPGEHVPLDVLRNTAQILVQGGVLTGVSQGTEFVFEGENEWTWEEYIQACLLCRLTAKSGRKNQTIKDPITKEITLKVSPINNTKNPSQKLLRPGQKSELLESQMKKTTENAKIQELRSQIQGEINELNILKNKIKNITDPVKKQLYEQIMRLREENIREKQKALEALIKIWGK